jgi:DNA primase catalytic subunit
LTPIDEEGNVLGDFDTMEYEQFAKYFVQRNAKYIGNHKDHIVCQEPDGSDAKYTSNLLSYRPDLYPITSKKIWKTHYESNYPFEKIWKWFGNKNREFCFEFPKEGGVGIATDWKRYVFFPNGEAFKNYVTRNLPVVIHIGSIYETNTKSEPKSKELMFDIDLDSYVDSNQNSIRRCCGKEKKCCDICWELALIAKTILEDVLKKTMGFKKVKFFASGGKGMHCWVMDEEPKTLSREGRGAILKFLESIKTAPKSMPMISIVKRFKKKYILDVLKSLGIEESDKKDKSAVLLPLWPRIDSGPTTEMTHPIKSPFALHRSTLKIAERLK